MARRRTIAASSARKKPGIANKPKLQPTPSANAPPSNASAPRHKRTFTKVHMNMLTSQLDDLKSVSNQTGLAMAALLRAALQHWKDHREPGNPLAFRCLYPRSEYTRVGEMEREEHYHLPMTKRASPPPAGQPDRRPNPSGRRPYRVPASETQNGEPLDIPHDRMVKFSRLLEKDFTKYPNSTSDDQARRLASRMGWSPLEAMSAMSGLDEGYLDADQDEEEEDDDA